MKTCNRCKIEKSEDCFEKERNACRDCRNIQRNARNAKKPKNGVSVLEKQCSCCKLIKSAEDFDKDPQKKSGLTAKCKECRKPLGKQYYNVNAEIIKKKNNEHYYKVKHTENFVETRKKRTRERTKNDVMFRVKRNLRNRLYYALDGREWKKDTHFAQYIGCTLPELRFHLEKQFKDGMSWQNYGLWEIDHVIPLDSAKTVDELYRLSHHSNLQPLWKDENRSKGAKIE